MSKSGLPLALFKCGSLAVQTCSCCPVRSPSNPSTDHVATHSPRSLHLPPSRSLLSRQFVFDLRLHSFSLSTSCQLVMANMHKASKFSSLPDLLKKKIMSLLGRWSIGFLVMKITKSQNDFHKAKCLPKCMLLSWLVKKFGHDKSYYDNELNYY